MKALPTYTLDYCKCNNYAEKRVFEFTGEERKLGENLTYVYKCVHCGFQDYLSYLWIVENEVKNKEPEIGRPTIGISKKVSITMPNEYWERVEELKTNMNIKSNSEFFRNLLQDYLYQIDNKSSDDHS